MLKVIIFDIDGVITNLSHFHYLAFKSVFSLYNINLSLEEWKSVEGNSRRAIVHRINKIHKAKLSEKTLEEISNKKNKLFVKLIKNGLTKNNIINGIKQLISEAYDRKLKLMAISTSSNAILEMECLGLSKKFDYISDYSIPELSNDNKNTVKSLKYALQIHGIRTDECLGLEDNIYGIRDYNNLGIFSVAIANYNEEIKKEANFYVDLPEQINIDEVIFNFYKKERADI